MRRLFTRLTASNAIAARAKMVPVQLLLCFFLVFAQSAALIHSHDGDLQRQFDCDICLKVNSTDHAVPSSTFDFTVLRAASFFTLPQVQATAASLPAFHARAPPALI